MKLQLSGEWSLSDEHAASSYGQPVLVTACGDAYGRADVVQLFAPYPWLPAHAAVIRFAATRRFTSDEADFIALFTKGTQ